MTSQINEESREFWPRFFWHRADSYFISNTAKVNFDNDNVPDFYFLSPEFIKPPFIVPEYKNFSGSFISQEDLFPREPVTDKKSLPALALAQSQGDVEGLLDFTYKFGLLTQGIQLIDHPSSNKYLGESCALWFKERWVLKNLFQLWEWIDKTKTDDLIKMFSYDYKRKGYQAVLSDIEILKEGEFKPSLLQAGNTPSELQRQVAQLNSINISDVIIYRGFWGCDPSLEVLPRLASCILGHLLSEKLSIYKSIFAVTYSVHSRRFEQVFQPTSLLSLIWYQFAHYVTKERRFKRCDVCGEWQDVTGRREHWKYHKNCGGKERRKKSRPPTGRRPGRPKKYITL